MTRVVTLPTDHRELGKALDSLAPNVRESAVHLVAPEAVVTGEWVRFRWTLADGTVFFEGAGKSTACRRHAAGGYELVLNELTFDPRNEAMFERILIAGEDRHTAPPSLSAPASASVPRRYSSMPPPPKPTRTGGQASAQSGSPPLFSASPSASQAARKPAPPPPGKLSNVLKGALKPKPSSMPPAATPTAAAIPVTPDLLAHARELARRMNLAAPALARGRWTEERVLRAALRMGLQSFEGLLAHKDGDQ